MSATLLGILTCAYARQDDRGMAFVFILARASTSQCQVLVVDLDEAGVVSLHRYHEQATRLKNTC